MFHFFGYSSQFNDSSWFRQKRYRFDRLGKRYFSYALIVFYLSLVALNGHSKIGCDLSSVAFFYGHSVPVEELSLYDSAVVEPSHISPEQLKLLRNNKTTVFSYLSLGEVNAELWQSYKLPSSLILGKNRGWNSYIIDQTRCEWRQHILKNLIPALVSAGFDGLFLDTLDSYLLSSHISEYKKAQRDALVQLIKEIKQQNPQLKLFMNRGFELFPDIVAETDILAAESLYRSFDPVKRSYLESSPGNQRWLLKKLQEIKAYGIPVVVIDYLPSYNLRKADKLAKRIADKGFIPWVTTPALNTLGCGLITSEPRKVLMLYNGEGLLAKNDIHILAGFIAEYIGLNPVYINIDQSLPNYPLAGRYAGMICWLSAEPSEPGLFQQWLAERLNENIPILFMGSLPVTDPGLLKKMGLSRVGARFQKPLVITQQSEYMGKFEAPLKPRIRGLSGFNNLSSQNIPWLTLKDQKGEYATPVLVADWGGMALYPYILNDNGTGYREWLFDPFALFSQALKLKSFPVPDTTTENGRRILTSHVDGDGFASIAELPGTPYSGTIIQKEIFERYPIPHTVSVIEGETGAEGLYPWLSSTLEPIAREIFNLPNVELATHSYSHPFFWQPDKMKLNEKETLYGFHLPIKNYTFNLEREIQGSIAYINKNLAPPGKKVNVFLWTGDALPGKKAIELTKAAGVVN